MSPVNFCRVAVIFLILNTVVFLVPNQDTTL